ncbi:hypothetical protein [Sphingomonas sp. CARO-RG-8B-R24-01]|uniref:hypothetical protein n=1 Tax=Sphingomonas sp. CARO-RG-8B-R24-01 TaxID=2914831 RepID=UPI001F570E91|nr:hypothetical protein [Sphingomonas sp. CARO-RG-8B-R24-01]
MLILPTSSRIVSVTAFIDWNSQIHAVAGPRGVSEVEQATRTLQYVGRRVANGLTTMTPAQRFDVTLRVYHGWHRGFQVTPRRKALLTVAAHATGLSNKSHIHVRPDIEFGDRLIAGSERRLHVGLNCHVPNTLRKSIRIAGDDEEKMVDTSIACDVVDLAYRDKDRWIIIVGEDDDLIPPLISADGIRGPKDGRVALFRSRNDSPFFKIDDIRIAS